MGDGSEGIDRARAELVRIIIHRDAPLARSVTMLGQEGHMHGDAVLRVLRAIAKGETPADADLAEAFAELSPEPGDDTSPEASADARQPSEIPGEFDPSPVASTDGFEEVTGLDAFEDAAADVRAAARGDVVDPLDGLADRIKAAGKPELAFDPLVIGAALDLRAEDAMAFDALKRALKSVKVSITDWSKALETARRSREREQVAEAQRAQQEARRRAAIEAAEARARQSAGRAEAKARAAEEDPDFEHHFSERQVDDTTYAMEPGKVIAESPGARGETKVVTLSNFSAPIVAEVSEYGGPDEAPVRRAVLSVVLGEGKPRRIEVPMRDFGRMDWVPEQLGARAWVASGRQGRERLAHALQALSSPTALVRYGYTGWQRHEGRPVYLHAGGAIGAEGVVPGVDVQVYEPVSRFVLPAPLEGDDFTRAATSVLGLFDLEPAGAVLPVLGQVFRAALGGARCSLHVYGDAGVGKSLLTALGQQFFAPPFTENAAPLSWRVADSKVAVTQILARAGDCVVMTDDLKLSGNQHADAELMSRADFVFASVYGAKGRHLGKREGGVRSQPAPRSVVLSSGEVLPRSGHSLVQRILPVLLGERMRGDVLGAMERGRAGLHAGFMATFLQWVARRYETLCADLPGQEVRLAAAWELGSGERAAKLLGAVALGLATLVDFLRASGLDEPSAARCIQRAQQALRALSTGYDEVAAEQNPARTFVEHLAGALASGDAHATTTMGQAPPSPHLYGWRPKGSSQVGGAPDYQPAGRRVGYVDVGMGRLYFSLKDALAVVTRRAREAGDVVNIDPNNLLRHLQRTGQLVSPEFEVNGSLQARIRLDGRRTRMPCITLDALMGSRDPEDEVGQNPGCPD